MAEDRQPSTVVEGATAVGAGAGVGGDVEDNELPPAAKSAEDRKAAAALSKLDARGDDDADAEAGAARGVVDQEAVSRAMNSLGAGGAGGSKTDAEKKDIKKVKVEPADVALLVDELELSKAKATELLRAHDGDAVQAIRAFITPVW